MTKLKTIYYKPKIPKHMFHIGKRVHEKIRQVKDRMDFKDVAEKLHIVEPALRKNTKLKSLQSERLYELSVILGHDFFLDLSKDLRERNPKLFTPAPKTQTIGINSRKRTEYKISIQDNRIVGTEEVLEAISHSSNDGYGS